MHPDLFPCEHLMFIPEPDEVHVRDPPVFLEPKEMIHSFISSTSSRSKIGGHPRNLPPARTLTPTTMESRVQGLVASPTIGLSVSVFLPQRVEDRTRNRSHRFHGRRHHRPMVACCGRTAA
jgi:hypothetical protein